MALAPSLDDPVFLAYVLAFGVAAVVCFATVTRVGRVEDVHTRRSLAALLVTSGGWATAHVGFLVSPWLPVKLAFYLAGLVVGFAAVFAWLYFCSSYTGRTLHLRAPYRRAAALLFVTLVLVKVTNPLHQWYFTTAVVATPFPHLSIQSGPLHWTAMGLAYALAFVGYFMLVEFYATAESDTTPLVALVAVTALPVALDVVGYAHPALVDITYEPLGVAAFAAGVGYVYFDRFRAVRIAGERDTPVVVLDGDDRVREINHRASDLFPGLEGHRGDELDSALPDVAAALDEDDPIVEVRPGDADGPRRYYRVSATPLGTVRSDLGRTLVLTDVTENERYRRELERQNDRLDSFASMVSHDLRNPLNVAQGRIALALEDCDDPEGHLAATDASLDRMEQIIDQVLSLARHGQPVEETGPVRLSDIVGECWGMVETADADLRVEDDLVFRAAPDRVRHLFENLFRNAIEHGGSDVTVTVGPLDDGAGFYVADDGPGIPEVDRDQVFEAGYTTDDDGTGFGLPIVAEVAEAHGWTARAVESVDGARFEVRDVDTESGPDAEAGGPVGPDSGDEHGTGT